LEIQQERTVRLLGQGYMAWHRGELRSDRTREWGRQERGQILVREGSDDSQWNGRWAWNAWVRMQGAELRIGNRRQRMRNTSLGMLDGGLGVQNTGPVVRGTDPGKRDVPEKAYDGCLVGHEGSQLTWKLKTQTMQEVRDPWS
jgi:hypothetical protein